MAGASERDLSSTERETDEETGEVTDKLTGISVHGEEIEGRGIKEGRKDS